ncbi:NifB/NifX family molybdenum-iron cluster-binding protein [Gorillibacterium sp. CAU 1737]|uniref:NifB/NifX family molybdenum-iron cluster-binding protein n=1 Tax=Gorillibacterium sp. CAU 1737 TaxID=3140362 RepID=UPI003260B695
MKVAFASMDGKTVDAHFGHCERFTILEIDEVGYRYVESRDVSHRQGEGEVDKIENRVAAVADCTLLFICQIGPAAAARVTRRGVMPIKVVQGTRVSEQLEQLHAKLAHQPPLWLVKAMRQAEQALEAGEKPER